MTREATYVIIDAEERNRENPETFEIPPATIRERLRISDLAKLCFEYPKGTALFSGDRMWVEIDTIRFPAGLLEYEGVLLNQPCIESLRAGDRIRFGPQQIIDFLPLEQRNAA